MNAKLTFNLPEDEYDLKCALEATRVQGQIEDIDNWLRNLLKHGGIKEYTADRLAEEVREKLNSASRAEEVREKLNEVIISEF